MAVARPAYVITYNIDWVGILRGLDEPAEGSIGHECREDYEPNCIPVLGNEHTARYGASWSRPPTVGALRHKRKCRKWHDV